MRYWEIIAESSPNFGGKVFYHGTPNQASAEKIMQNGIQPPDFEAEGRTRNTMLRPVEGRVYLTPDLGAAIMYAIGGNFAGDASLRVPYEGNEEKFSYVWSETGRHSGRYGYVFAVPGEELTAHLQPDEDQVGEIFGWCLSNGPSKFHGAGDHALWERFNSNPNMASWIKHLMASLVTPNEERRIKDGEYAYYAKFGKKVLRNKKFTDDMRAYLVNIGCHVAHLGAARPSQCWRLDKAKIGWVNKDGSNFFEIAEEIPLNVLAEKAPPGKKAKRFLQKTKKDFKSRYGKHWKTVQYATAWKMFGESLMESERGDDLLRRLWQRATEHGADDARDSVMGSYITDHMVRTEVAGAAIPFFQSEEAQRMADDAGWTLTAFEPYERMDGLDEQGRQKYRTSMQVRLENHEGEAVGGWNAPHPKELFHVTISENVPTILKNGLEPRPSRRLNMHRYGPRIYLAVSLQGAEAIVRNLQKVDGGSDYTILKIDPAMVGPMFVDQEFRRQGVYTKEAIPPQAISVVEPVLTEMVLHEWAEGANITDYRLPGGKDYEGDKPVAFVVLAKDGGALLYNWGSRVNTLDWQELRAIVSREMDRTIQNDDTDICLYRNGYKLRERMDDTRWPASRNQFTPNNRVLAQALLDRGLATPQTPLWVGNWARHNEGVPIGSVGKILAAPEVPTRLTMYHGTSNYRWEEIQRAGVLAPMQTDERIWKKGTMLGDSIYLTCDYEKAVYYAQKAVNVDRARRNWPDEEGGKLKPVVLQVTLGAADIRKLLADDDHINKAEKGERSREEWLDSLQHMSQVAYRGSLPASRLRVVTK